MIRETEEDIPISEVPKGYQLNLSDFALFLSVMRVQRAYEDVLSIILDEPELKLEEVKVEQVILNKSGKRAIRLDAWATDENDRQFDVEMDIIEFGIQKGMEKGMEKGIQQGLEQGIRKMVCAMLANGYPYNEVARIANMPEDKVKQIEQEYLHQIRST